MGRIRTKLVKRLTNDVFKNIELTDDFAKNKQLMGKHVKTESKKMRNVLAGYGVQLAKLKARQP
ncbi:MAG: 30S ribosomal protein S17e [Candidatus Woesearchaeota archaeon]